MANDENPTINDFLDRLYTIRDGASSRAREETQAITARNAARGRLRSGATLKALAELIEKEFNAALAEMLATLRHIKAVPGIDYRACRDQAYLRARDLILVLSGACELEKWIGLIGRGTAGDVINRRVEALFPKIDYCFRQFEVGLDQVVINGAGVVSPAASLTALMQDQDPRPFQVALSFAGEQRDYVREVAEILVANDVAVFYDEFEANTLWGKDGADHFHEIYSRRAQYVVMFISADYVAKAWTRHEQRAAISRQMRNDAEYILPVRFDDSEVPGLPDTLQYLTADRFTPRELAIEIERKIGIPPASRRTSDIAVLASELSSGEGPLDRSLIWRPTMIGARAKLYLDVGLGAVEKLTAAVRAVDGVQSVELDRVGTSRSVIAIEMPASGEVVQRSIADRAIAAALQIDPTISVVS